MRPGWGEVSFNLLGVYINQIQQKSSKLFSFLLYHYHTYIEMELSILQIRAASYQVILLGAQFASKPDFFLLGLYGPVAPR